MNQEDKIYVVALHEASIEILTLLHDYMCYCDHCGKRNCAGRLSQSKLPPALDTKLVLLAIETGITNLINARIKEQ